MSDDPSDLSSMSDADIIAALQQHAAAFLAPQAQGTPAPTSQNADNALSSFAGATRAATRGATFGLSDYPEAASRYLIHNAEAAINPDENQGTTFNDALQSVRQDVGTFRKQHPVAAYGTEVAGGLVSPGFTRPIGEVGSLMANAPPYARYAAQGGMGGLLAGLGNAQSPSGGIPSPGDTAQSAAAGTLTGAFLGATVPAAAEGGGWMAGKVNSGLGATFDQFSAPTTAFARRLALAAQRDGITPDQMLAKVQALGPQGTLADLGGNIQGLARASSTMPGPSLKAAQDLATSRAAGQSDRLTQAALDAAGVSHIDEAIAKRSVMSKPIWDAALNQGQSADGSPVTTNSVQITSPTVQRLLTRPDVQSGIQTGIKYALDEGAITGEPVPLQDYALQRNPDSGQFEVNGTPTMRLLEAARRGMASNLQGDSYHNPQTGRLNEAGFHLNGMLQTLTNQMDELSAKDPDTGVALTKLARDSWAGPSDTIAALAQVQHVADTARDNSDMTGRLFGSKALRDKLSGLFPDDASLAQFAQTVKNEGTMADTNRFVGGKGQSQTAYMRAAQADMEQPTGMDAMESLNRNPSWENVIWQSLRGAKNWLTSPPQSIADQATPLFSRDPAVQQAAVAAMAQRMNGTSLMGRALPPRATLLGAPGRNTGALMSPFMTGGSNQ